MFCVGIYFHTDWNRKPHENKMIGGGCGGGGSGGGSGGGGGGDGVGGGGDSAVYVTHAAESTLNQTHRDRQRPSVTVTETVGFLVQTVRDRRKRRPLLR